jgi:hypothetical protein
MLGTREFWLYRESETAGGRGQPARISFVSLLCARCPTSRGGEKGLAMSGTKIDRRVGPVDAAAGRDDRLIARAAKRTDWAGTALESAAVDLEDADGGEGRALTSLAEVVQEEAVRLSHLAEDIESHRHSAQPTRPGGGSSLPSKSVKPNRRPDVEALL